MTPEGKPEAGDTISWKNPRNKTPCWGLVDWIDEKGLHVRLSQSGMSKVRTVIQPDRVTQSWPGRTEFDRRAR